MKRFGRGDHVQIELLDLADFLIAVIFGRACARWRHRRPRNRVRGRLGQFSPSPSRSRSGFFVAPLPTFVSKVGERVADGAGKDHRTVVPRHIGFAVRRGAVRIAVLVIARIPAPRSDVDAAADREMVVEHRDLLVMAASDRMRRCRGGN